MWGQLEAWAKPGSAEDSWLPEVTKLSWTYCLFCSCPGPWKAMLVAAAAREFHGAAVLLRQAMLSVLPISTQTSGATSPAPDSSPDSFTALSTPFCPWPRARLPVLLSRLSLPKTAEKPWAGAAFGHLFGTCLTDSNASKNLISKCKPIIQSKDSEVWGQNCMEDPV